MTRRPPRLDPIAAANHLIVSIHQDAELWREMCQIALAQRVDDLATIRSLRAQLSALRAESRR